MITVYKNRMAVKRQDGTYERFDVFRGPSGKMDQEQYDPEGAVEEAGGIPAYVDANGGKIDKIKVNNVEQAITDKTVSIAVPKALAFTVQLSTTWTSNAQTVQNANFLASDYVYTVAPSSSDFAKWAEAMIYADNVTTDGQMTFHCDTVPTSAITVNILRVEV